MCVKNIQAMLASQPRTNPTATAALKNTQVMWKPSPGRNLYRDILMLQVTARISVNAYTIITQMTDH